MYNSASHSSSCLAADGDWCCSKYPFIHVTAFLILKNLCFNSKYQWVLSIQLKMRVFHDGECHNSDAWDIFSSWHIGFKTGNKIRTAVKYNIQMFQRIGPLPQGQQTEMQVFNLSILAQFLLNSCSILNIKASLNSLFSNKTGIYTGSRYPTKKLTKLPFLIYSFSALLHLSMCRLPDESPLVNERKQKPKKTDQEI